MEFEIFGVEGEPHFRKATLGRDFRQALCSKARFAAGVEHLFDGICPEQVEAVAGQGFGYQAALVFGALGKVEFFQHFMQTDAGVGAAREMVDVGVWEVV